CEAACEEVFEDRRVGSRQANAKRVRQHMPARPVRAFLEQDVAAIVDLASRIIEAAEILLEAQLQVLTFRRKDRDVPRVISQRDAARKQVVVAQHGIKLGNSEEARIVNINVLAQARDRDRSIGREAVAEGEPSAEPLFAPVRINTIVQVAADVEADGGVAEKRVGEADQVALHLAARDGFQPQPLPAATKRLATDQLVKTARQAADV